MGRSRCLQLRILALSIVHNICLTYTYAQRTHATLRSRIRIVALKELLTHTRCVPFDCTVYEQTISTIYNLFTVRYANVVFIYGQPCYHKSHVLQSIVSKIRNKHRISCASTQIRQLLPSTNIWVG